MVLQVIGAGFGRTGTLSLKVALELIGFGPCHHGYEVFKNKNEEALFFLDAGSVLHDNQEKVVDWDLMYGKYKAAVDFPTSLFYEQLMAKYPKAKLILAIREPEKWYVSVKSTIYAFRSDTINSDEPIVKLGDELLWDENGIFKGRFEDKESTIKIFNEHIEEEKRHVPDDRLRVFNVKEGWEPLCKFLDVPVPDSEFPRINDRETTAKIAEQWLKEIEGAKI